MQSVNASSVVAHISKIYYFQEINENESKRLKSEEQNGKLKKKKKPKESQRNGHTLKVRFTPL